MSIGAELRQARQQAGLSTQELSQRTKIQLAKVEALEADAFERLPEGVYLDGLLRAYAAAVGRDGEDLVARLHRQKEQALAEVAPAAIIGRRLGDENFGEYDLESFPHEDRLTDSPDSFSKPLLLSRDLDDRNIRGPVTDLSAQDDFTTQPAVERFAALDDVHETPMLFGTGATQSSSSRGSVGRVLVPALVVLAAIGLGAYLYDRTHPDPTAEITAPVVSHETDSNQLPDAATVSRDRDTPVDVVPADRPATTEHHADTSPTPPTTAPRPSTAPAVTPNTITGVSRGAPNAPDAAAPGTSAPGTAAPGTPARAASVPGAPKPAEPAPAEPSGRTQSAREPARSAPGAPSAPSPSAPEALAPSAPTAPDLSGSWTLDTTVEASVVQDFQGLRLGYRLELQQAGNRVTGEGRKMVENGKQIVEFAQTPIVVTGTIDGTRLTLTFTERGRRRESGGKMILDLLDGDVMRGRFSSSAAQSSGTVEARRPGV
jgi:cytoskeletal protein RodZ